MVHLDYRDSRPIYEQIADNFRNQIRAGVLLPGDKLPSVRELASTLAINPNTIHRAYLQLETEGWVANRGGRGCFVCGSPEGDYPELTPLWEEFGQAAKKLLKAGVAPNALIQYLRQGGEKDA